MSGNTIYVTGDAPSDDIEHNVYSYNTMTDSWKQLPQSGHRYGVLCMVDDKLTIFGGRDSTTNDLHKKVTTYDSGKNKWISHYPDMLYVRSKPGVISYQDYIIVMGGGYNLCDNRDNIEVMDYRQPQWKELAVHLPVPMYNITPTISGKYVTIVGYSGHTRQTKSYQMPVKDITLPKDMPYWKELNPPTHYNTATIPYSNPPVIVGGETHNFNCTSTIKMYDLFTNSWESVDYLTCARDTVGIAYINEHTIIVIGGTSGGSPNSNNCLTTVEKGHIVEK